jgi:hypothetical protein
MKNSDMDITKYVEEQHKENHKNANDRNQRTK